MATGGMGNKLVLRLIINLTYQGIFIERPIKYLASSVVILDEGRDRCNQLFHRPESSSQNCLPRQDAEPDLNLVQPRLDVLMFVSAQVVYNQMQVFALVFAPKQLDESQELFVAMAFRALPN